MKELIKACSNTSYALPPSDLCILQISHAMRRKSGRYSASTSHTRAKSTPFSQPRPPTRVLPS